MAIPFFGGCICGAVRYECSAEPIVSGFCHCRDCQRETGSAFATTLFVPQNAVRITGEVRYYNGNGDSGHVVSRGFCPTCGARLFGKPMVLPEVIAIRAGSLDDPSWFRPERDIYVGSAQPWDFMNPTLPNFAKNAANVILPTLRVLHEETNGQSVIRWGHARDRDDRKRTMTL